MQNTQLGGWDFTLMQRIEPVMRMTSCPNLNHRRSKPTIRFCPQCGERVNGDVAVKPCTQTGHAEKRQHREAYCIDCGEQLIK